MCDCLCEGWIVHRCVQLLGANVCALCSCWAGCYVARLRVCVGVGRVILLLADVHACVSIL